MRRRSGGSFLSKHYDYLGTDISDEFINIAKQGNPCVDFKRLSVYEVSRLPGQYDGFWCCATLLHIPKRNIDAVLAALRNTLRPGGVGFISIQQGSGEHMEASSFAPDLPRRLFVYYASEEFISALQKSGFAIIRFETKTRAGFTKQHEEATWLSFFVRAI